MLPHTALLHNAAPYSTIQTRSSNSFAQRTAGANNDFFAEDEAGLQRYGFTAAAVQPPPASFVSTRRVCMLLQFFCERGLAAGEMQFLSSGGMSHLQAQHVTRCGRHDQQRELKGCTA